jgi:ankyrin repeat protein
MFRGREPREFLARLHAICAEGDSVEDLAAACSENPRCIHTKDDRGYTVLHVAVVHIRVAQVRYLCEIGANVNAKGRNGTPLHVALLCETVSHDIVDALVRRGACPHILLHDLGTPLEIAYRRDLRSIWPMLISDHRHVYRTFRVACERDDADVALALLSRSRYLYNDPQGRIPSLICSTGAIRTFRMFVDRTSVFGDAARPLFVAAMNGQVEMVQMLLQRGAHGSSLVLHEGSLVTPLEIAIIHGHTDVARCFPDATAYRPAVIRSMWGRAGCAFVHTLVHMGTSISRIFPWYMKDGAHTMEFIDVCRSHGASIGCVGLLHRACRLPAEWIRFFVSRGADVNAVDARGRAPLHEACVVGSASHVETLCSLGADVHARTPEDGETPLHVWARTCVWEPALDVCETLLSCGADIHARDGAGRTALHVAMACGTSARARLLVERGADVLVCDAHGRVPFQCIPRDADRVTMAEMRALMIRPVGDMEFALYHAELFGVL